MSRPVTWSLTLDAADADGISLSQTPAVAGNLTITGALATGGVATMDDARRVRVTTVADESAKTLTIYGTNHDGNAIVESMTGPNATTGDTGLDFKTVTRVAVSAAFTDAVTVGTNGVGSTKWFKANPHISPSHISFMIVVTGTVNYDIEHTLDNPDMPANMLEANNTAIPTVFNHATIAAQTANVTDSYISPVRGARLTLNSGTGTAEVTFLQAGISGNM